jgi:PAS domain S-box-containing protein
MSLSQDPTRCLQFLSEASKILSSSLDPNETFASLARLAVPALGDWCSILRLEEDGSLKRVIFLHSDPARMVVAEDYLRRYPLLRVQGHPDVPDPFSSGQSFLLPQVSDEMLAAMARDQEELEALRAFEMKSQMIVPLIARRRMIGLFVLISSDSGRIFTPEDLALAEDLAARAAMAMDNALLYSAEQQARAEAVRSAERVRESEQLLRGILDNSGAIIFVTDADGRYLLVNREWERRTPRSDGPVLGRSARDFVPADVAARAAANTARVLAENRPIQFETDVVQSDGVHTYLTLKFPIEGLPFPAVGGICTDITARQREEAALRASQERFATIFRASTVAITISRFSDGQFLDANDAGVQLSGFTLEELLSHSSAELGLWARAEDRVRVFEQLRQQGSVHGLETVLRRKSGELRDVRMTLDLIDVDGQTCILALTHDTTELKGLENRLRRAQKMEALGRLAGGVAHDFNNLITAINGYAALVLDSLPPSASARAGIEHIQRAAGRAASLTQQLLVFGRPQARPPAVVDVNAALSGLAAHMLHRLIGEDIRVETVLAPELVRVEIDPVQLEQVLLNLALNARDAMPKGGRLRITTSNQLGDDSIAWARLRVEDEGDGMDEATLAHIFEPFFTTKEPGKGTGLGLATVYTIVEQAGGRIAVSSQPGRGSCFEILLPAVTGDLQRSTDSHATVPMRRGHATILVVEDDEAVCAFVSMVLSMAGYTVLTASDGPAAIALLAQREGRIDLLLTDIVMPHMNGRALAHELRQRLPNLCVMYMSGYPGDTIERYGDIPAGELFLQKPFTRELLLMKVAEALEPRVTATG